MSGALQRGDQSARNMLIEHNMRLVAHVVKKYQCPDYETEDLLSVGTIGLIKAVNTFNADKGSKLATYAARCVENEVLMKLRSNKKLAREVSLYEPIGVDKDGETVSLMDVIEMENPETIDGLILDQDIREMYRAFDRCLTDPENRSFPCGTASFGQGAYTEGNCSPYGDIQILCQPD